MGTCLGDTLWVYKKVEPLKFKFVRSTGCTKKTQTIENDLLLEFQCPRSKRNVKSANS